VSPVKFGLLTATLYLGEVKELTPAIAILTERIGYNLAEAIATKHLLRTASFVINRHKEGCNSRLP